MYINNSTINEFVQKLWERVHNLNQVCFTIRYDRIR